MIGRYIAVLAVGVLLGAGGFYAIQPAVPAQAQELSAEERAKLQAQYDQLQKEIEQLLTNLLTAKTHTDNSPRS